MNEILGGIAEWLHEYGIRTNYDFIHQVWLGEAGKLSPPRLIIYSATGKPKNILWIEGDRLLQYGGVKHSFELADSGFLDELLLDVKRQSVAVRWC